MGAPRILVLRLSSFGDVVLSTVALQAIRLKHPRAKIVFVSSVHYRDLLEGHPEIDELVLFDRKTGLKGWLRLLREEFKKNPQMVLDLHNTLRTQLARVYWSLSQLRGLNSESIWKTVSKERVRTLLSLILKARTPEFLRARPWVQKFSEILGPTAPLKTDFRWILKTPQNPRVEFSPPYICVMPSSKWHSKEWPVERWAEMIFQRWGGEAHTPRKVFVLGTQQDYSSLQLSELLKSRWGSERVGFAPEPMSFTQAAQILKNSEMFLGVDTGFFHLAESLGVPSVMIMGPTSPLLGYGPQLASTQILEQKLGCRPCSKTGKICYRFWEPRACLERVQVSEVLRASQNAQKFRAS